MELRAYWAVIRRRFWIIALVVGVVALYVGYQYYTTHKTPNASRAYKSSVTMRIALQNTGNRTTNQNYADYEATSESLADAFVTGPLLTSDDFGMRVIQQVHNDMGVISQRFGAKPDLGTLQEPALVTAALKPTRAHNLVTIDVTWETEAGAWALAHAVGEVSQTSVPRYLDYQASSQSQGTGSDANRPLAAAEVLSDATMPKIDPAAGSGKTTLLLAMLAVGVIIAIALAFLVEYLDDRIRSKDDVVRLLQLPVYAEVPRPPTFKQAGQRQTLMR